YSELSCFGTASVIIEEDPKITMRCRTQTVGEYALDVGEDGRVDTLYRRIRMTPRQVLQAWPETCPENIKHLAEQNASTWLTILHAVEPNTDTVRGSWKAKERPWRSVYLVLEGANREVLEDSGYYEFPALCPRWVVTGSDIYGAAPAMDALPDCRQLQKLTEDGRLSLEMEVGPPMLVAQNGVTGGLDLSPRAINYTNALLKGQEVAIPLVQARANLQALAAEKQDLKDQIQRHFHNDLFLMISDVNKQMTAREVAERNSEKLLMLGPVLDRLRSELFQPLIERVYGIMDRAGMIAFPPSELAGQQIKVEFISILAQAQKQAGLAAVDQLVQRAGQLSQLLKSPAPLEKLNEDGIMDIYADLLGTPPNLVLGDEDLAAKRNARMQQQAQMQMLAAAQQGADAAEKGTRAMSNVLPKDQEQADMLAAMQEQLGGGQ
ncbi:MAG: portal protein, partial [Halodesulfovibrio sp.]